jgi:hypothetical protein
MTNRSLLLHRLAIGLLSGALLALAGRHYSAVHELAPVRVIIQQSEARNAQNASLRVEIQRQQGQLQEQARRIADLEAENDRGNAMLNAMFEGIRPGDSRYRQAGKSRAQMIEAGSMRPLAVYTISACPIRPKNPNGTEVIRTFYAHTCGTPDPERQIAKDAR